MPLRLDDDTEKKRQKESSEMDEMRTGFELCLASNLPDFTVVAGAQGQHIWPVHGDVLSRHSGYFKVMLESGFKEASEKKVALPEDDPTAVARMVIWMYYTKFAFDEDPSLPLAKMLRAEPHTIDSIIAPKNAVDAAVFKATAFTAMYEIADKYDVQALTQEAIKNLGNMVNDNEEIFWTLRKYIAGSEINCQPFEDILKAATKPRR